jgi:hypothetical protein
MYDCCTIIFVSLKFSIDFAVFIALASAAGMVNPLVSYLEELIPMKCSDDVTNDSIKKLYETLNGDVRKFDNAALTIIVIGLFIETVLFVYYWCKVT